MVNKEPLSLRFLLAAFFLILAGMIFLGLYPFNFFPPNGVRWLPNKPGLYFDGAGIAYTDRRESISIKKALSIELLLRERPDSKNWGPREIFSFYDGAHSPSLLVGQRSGRIFIYSRFEKNEGHKWYRRFRTKHRFPRGTAHLVTITFDKKEKAIYLDGQLSDRKNVKLKDGTHIEFSGSFLLGNSYSGNNGWMGEIQGLAIYNRILLPDEIVTHRRDISKKGMIGLAETPGCSALYPFDEREGNTAKSISNKPRPFTIPVSMHALPLTILSLPYNDMRSHGVDKADFLENIVFFVPFGILLTAIMLKKYRNSYFSIFLTVTLAGALLSIGIEASQLFLPTRYSGMADIVSNILGNGFGMLATFTVLKQKL